MTSIPNKPMPPPPAKTHAEPEDEYHAKSKSGECMSSGMLKKFRECPFAYHQAVTGQLEEKTSDAFRFGRAVHKIVLEGEKAFNKAYAIGGPINEKTGKSFGVGTKAHEEWLAANGYTREQVINDTEADGLVKMANMVRRHPGARDLLAFGWPELVARADLHGVPCQIRMDWLTHDQAGNFAIVDLKTTSDITWFEHDARRFGYPYQLALYRDVFQTATGIPVQMKLLAVEKEFPFRVCDWNISTEVLDYYSGENRATLENFKLCKQRDDWPTGYEATRDFSLPREKIGA